MIHLQQPERLMQAKIIKIRILKQMHRLGIALNVHFQNNVALLSNHQLTPFNNHCF